MGKVIFEFIWELFGLGIEVGNTYVTFRDMIIYIVLGGLLIKLVCVMLGGD